MTKTSLLILLHKVSNSEHLFSASYIKFTGKQNGGFRISRAPIVEIQTQIYEKLQVYRSANKQNFERCVRIYIFCDFDVVSDCVQRKLFSKMKHGFLLKPGSKKESLFSAKFLRKFAVL